MVKDNTFGKQLKKAREQLGWTQPELAEKMKGIQSKQNISNWENGVCLPVLEVRNELQEILGFSIENERKTRMNIKPLVSLETLEETEQAIESIIQGFNFQSQRREYIDHILKKCLWLMVGYYRYIVDSNERKNAKHSGWEYESPVWSYIGEDLKDLIDPCMEETIVEAPSGSNYPLSIKIDSYVEKISFELFEDVDEDGYRDGFVQEVAREGEMCGYDLIKLLPANNIETDTTMEIRYAIYKLSEYMSEI